MLPDRSNQKHFHRFPVVIDAEKARRDHARVVDDEHVAGAKVLRKISHRSVRDVAGGAVEDEQTRGIPPRSGFLCDEFRGERILELG
jgi:hypothetical protein